ncbi:MAG: hypothetical protein WC758_05725 [Candidatus Woesearchaeota archaeon]|jgi:hypothetical protein
MAFPPIQNEWIESVEISLGITSQKAQEEFRSFLLSSYAKYDQLLPTYIRRNLSFMSDSLMQTLSHATVPASNPSGFGLAFGSFIGLMMNAEDPYVCKVMFSDLKTNININKMISILKSINGLDVSVVKEISQHMNTSMLDPAEQERYALMVQSI